VNDLRRALSFVFLPLVVLFEALGWFGLRSVQVLYLVQELGLDYEHVGRSMAIYQGLSVVSVLLGGAVAVAVGPHLTLLAGLLVLAVTVGTFGLAPPSLLVLWTVALAVGTGLFRPSLYAAALVPFSGKRALLGSALVLLLYGALNVGAGAASVGAAQLAGYGSSGWRVLFPVLGSLMLVGAVMAGVLVLARWLLPVDEEPPTPADRLDWRPLAAAAGLIALGLIPVMVLYQSFSLQFDALQVLSPGGNWEWMLQINPVVVVAVVTLLAPALLVLHFVRPRLPILLPVGAGMVVLAVGSLLVLSKLSLPVVLAGTAVVALGEVAALPLLVARLGTDVHWRLAALVVAVWLALTTASNVVVAMVPDTNAQPVLSTAVWGGAAGLAMVCGLVVAVAAIPLQRFVYGQDCEPESASSVDPA